MEVILKKNVDKLGYANEIVKVKPGYGRNFLIPQGYAILATASAKKAHEEVMRQKAHKETKLAAEAKELASKLAESKVSIVTKAGENGKIFGSVNTVQLSEALKNAGFEIDRRSISIKNEPIKEVGTYEAEANLFKGVKQLFSFEVVAEQ
jgi:large subunit ribosomal protein L9